MKHLLVLAMLLAACGASAEAEPTTTAPDATTTTAPALHLDGTLRLMEFSFLNVDEWLCEGRGGFDNIREGANVVVKDGDGNVVGVGSLSGGEVPDEPRTQNRRLNGCLFEFQVDLARDAPFYTVEVAGRGGPTYSHADLEDGGWTVDLTLG